MSETDQTAKPVVWYEVVLYALASLVTLPATLVIASRLFNAKNDFLFVVAGIVLVGGLLGFIKLVYTTVKRIQAFFIQLDKEGL